MGCQGRVLRGLEALKYWARLVTQNYRGVEINNFGPSFRDGLAFCAILHRYCPDKIPFDQLRREDVYKNNDLAFRVAEEQFGICDLLEATDMSRFRTPDEKSVILYLSTIYHRLKLEHPKIPIPGQVDNSFMRNMFGYDKSLRRRKTDVITLSTRSYTCVECACVVQHLHQRFLGDDIYHRWCFENKFVAREPRQLLEKEKLDGEVRYNGSRRVVPYKTRAEYLEPHRLSAISISLGADVSSLEPEEDVATARSASRETLASRRHDFLYGRSSRPVVSVSERFAKFARSHSTRLIARPVPLVARSPSTATGSSWRSPPCDVALKPFPRFVPSLRVAGGRSEAMDSPLRSLPKPERPFKNHPAPRPPLRKHA